MYPTLYYNRGIVYGDHLGQYNLALGDMDKAIDLDPNNAKYKEYRKKAAELVRNVTLPSPAPTTQPSTQISERSANDYVEKGIDFAEQGDHEGAIGQYGEAIRLDPRNSNAYIARGWAYAALGRYKRAIADYDEVIRLDPKSAATFISRGSAYGVLEQFDRAIKDLDEATRLNPQYPVAYYLRGLIYEELGKSKEADRDFKKAKELGFTP